MHNIKKLKYFIANKKDIIDVQTTHSLNKNILIEVRDKI